MTAIELLSPANKHGDGAREYRDRRNDLLHTATHLIEIDLLRRGERILLDGEPPPAAYYVYLSRTQRRPFTQVWAVALRRRLPTIPVPLLPNDPDTYLDIHSAVDSCCARRECARRRSFRISFSRSVVPARARAGSDVLLSAASSHGTVARPGLPRV